jgi:hypothetical protein
MLNSSGAIPAARPLNRPAFPNILDAPTFRNRTRPVAQDAPLFGRLRRWTARQMLFAAAFAAIVLAAATTIPALAALRSGTSESTVLSTYHSSAGVTATAANRVDDLSTTTFVGSLPFVQQARYYSAVTHSQPSAWAFVEGARQASLGQYVQDVSTDIALPYLNSAAETSRNAAAWSNAVAENERNAAVAAAVASSPTAAWQAPPITNGTRLAGATVTFYACVGNGFCGNMSTGQRVFAGAAACSSDLPYGTRFTVANDPTGRVFVCLDRGALAPTWVDIWFYNAADGWAWQSYVGTVSDIIIQ